jgi:glycosyltransferase involved in cell wall biosynthesis
MRIAVLTHTRHLVGGAETYLDSVLPVLASRGHTLALCTETGPVDGRPLADGAIDRELEIESDVPAFVRALAEWKPDVTFLHGLDAVTVERAVTDRWRATFFAHTYYGACISSSKTFSFPGVTPCVRTLGPGCLVRYLPRRCGGLSPVSMWRAYGLQSDRRQLLPRYSRVLTMSRHMRAEYLRHGVREDRCHVVPHFSPVATVPRVAPDPSVAVRLLFAGRMEPLKGAHVFLDALPVVAAALARPVTGILVGDGACRPALDRQAARIRALRSEVRTEFTGWLSREEVSRVLGDIDLLVVPSVWPEPLGLIGAEAGAQGVPAAAFDVGGIGEWLIDGRTGHLAAGPGDARALAAAIVRCVGDASSYRRLSEGALDLARMRTLDAHVTALESHLVSASREPGATAAGESAS